jgi:signal transduction histidine kinase
VNLGKNGKVARTSALDSAEKMWSTFIPTCVIAVLLSSMRFWDRWRRPDAPTTAPEATDGSRLKPRSEELLELIEEGVLTLDDSLTAIGANRAARMLLGTGQALPSRLPSDELSSIARRVVVDHLPVEDIVELRTPARMSLQVRVSYLDETGGVVMLLRDISEDQRSQRVRRQFVTHASHELKTPIAAIQVLAEAVTTAVENDPSKARQFADSLLNEAQRLNMLVTDLLDLSRLEDPGTIANSIADLSAVATAELAQATPTAAAKAINVLATIDEAVIVRGDDSQLALMIRNLLDNAVRYTPHEGEISLEVRTEGEDAIVRVSDTGVGIPLRDQARVFERFYRVDEGRSREQGGTGLGLAIVKHVADLHGGHVSVSSQLGEGSTFTVALPSAGRRTHEGPASEGAV